MVYIRVSPYKKLYLEGEGADAYHELKAAFTRGNGHGLLFLDSLVADTIQEDSLKYWQEFVRCYLANFVSMPELDKCDLTKNPVSVNLAKEDLISLLQSIPAMQGAEYVDEECLLILWGEIEKALVIEIQESGGEIASFFAAKHTQWNLLGKVCFNLAENKNSQKYPFAFLATYVHQLAKDGKSKHLPLMVALDEYSEEKNLLLRLLEPIHKASQESSFLKEYVDSGNIYRPLTWSAKEAHQFLIDVPLFEKAGIVVKIPNWWKKKQSNSPKLQICLGEDQPTIVGSSALLNFDAAIMLGEEELSEADIQALLLQNENLVFFKGQWVEVDKTKLDAILKNWKKLHKQMKNEQLTFAESLRWLSGFDSVASKDDVEVASYTQVLAGEWLEETLTKMSSPHSGDYINNTLNGHLNATLRPYQSQGIAWLNMLNQLKLGGILADDMGLGKTLQIIALLLFKKLCRQDGEVHSPALLIVPASLISNWKAEIDKFAPSLSYLIVHSSASGLKKPSHCNVDIIISTYGSLLRCAWFADFVWGVIILDEAQAIKNPEAKQTKAIKKLQAQHKLALTGTPVENRLSDLWSIFDFVAPRLLGSIDELTTFLKRQSQKGSPYAALRSLVSPYILRRMKTDKKIIADLPDKTELKTYCSLSKAQIALYQQSVAALAEAIEKAEGMERRGIILAYLIRFKQICNHPSQLIKDGKYNGTDSGKFIRLKEICEVIAAKQEKVLVFTQFKEMTEPLADFLCQIFGRSGMVLHGSTNIKKRTEMVKAFQREDGPPYFVLSLKAGGTGLNLTAASHVIHFDRWWNPAIENQATDRAFRIGQKHNVLVHKFICQGTLEAQIDNLIESKLSLSKELLDLEGSAMLTELSNNELLKLVTLDVKSAINEVE